MSDENKSVIDIISLDKDDVEILTIADHLEWYKENEHLILLQDKINAYLTAIENGEQYVNFPNAKNKKISIRIIALYIPNEDGVIFLAGVEEILKKSGYEFRFEQKII